MKTIVFFLALLSMVSCTSPENKVGFEGDKLNLEENKLDFEQSSKIVVLNTLQSTKEIEHYPARFSYASDKLKDNLFAKIQKPLTFSQKEVLFKTEFIPYEVQDENYEVFAINKISFESATLLIFLAKEIQTESMHESDQLILVLYNREGNLTDILSKTLEDIYGSTYEIEFSSPNDFSVINTDIEYSPDPESEAEDIASGRIIEPSYREDNYQVKGAKFVKE